MQQALKIKLNIIGYGVNYLVFKPDAAFMDALSIYSINNNCQKDLAIFDLDFFECLNIPGINSYMDLNYTHSYIGMDLSMPGTLEIKNGRNIILKKSVNQLLAPSLFDNLIITNHFIDLNELDNCIVIKETITGQISGILFDILELTDLTNLIYPLATIKLAEKKTNLLFDLYLENHQMTTGKNDYVIRTSEAYFINKNNSNEK